MVIRKGPTVTPIFHTLRTIPDAHSFSHKPSQETHMPDWSSTCYLKHFLICCMKWRHWDEMWKTYHTEVFMPRAGFKHTTSGTKITTMLQVNYLKHWHLLKVFTCLTQINTITKIFLTFNLLKQESFRTTFNILFLALQKANVVPEDCDIRLAGTCCFPFLPLHLSI